MNHQRSWRIGFGVLGLGVLMACSGLLTEEKVAMVVEAVEQENHADACRDLIDNDQDGHIDCDDQDCGFMTFCAPPEPPRPPGPSSADAEQVAKDLYAEANDLVTQGRAEEARAKVDLILSQYAETSTASRATRLRDELALIGRLPPALDVDFWFQGSTGWNDGSVTMVVFWEAWCPHCKRELPKLQQKYATYGSRGFNLFGLTKMTRSSTESDVRQLISEHGVTYPIAKENGQTMSDAFNVSGVPAAAVIQNGRIIWRGHPAKVTEEMIEGWL